VLPEISQKPAYTDLAEHSLYLVDVSWESRNPIHRAVLLTGFHTGAYWSICNNSYNSNLAYDRAYYVKIVKYLGRLNET
jgi:hypothetical protein